MKRVKHLAVCLMLMVSALSLVACHLDELGRGDNNAGPESNGTEVGYLRLQSLVLNVDNESFDLNTDANAKASTRADEDAPAQNKLYEVPNPNGIEENLNKYWIEVKDEVVNQMVDINGDAAGEGCYYKDIPREGIALEPGRYTVYAYKTIGKNDDVNGVIADVAGQLPADGDVIAYYAGHSSVVNVVSGQNTDVVITCKLTNVITTVELSADLQKWFKKDENGATMLSTNVAIASATGKPADTYSYTFPYTSNHGIVDNDGVVVDGGPFVYFKDVAGPGSTEGNVLQLNMAGTFYTGQEIDLNSGQIDDSKWADVSMSRTITDVKAAQWRRISIDIDRNNEGNIQFVVTVESMVYDETINVDVVTLYAALNIEEEVPDVGVENPKAPNVSIKDVVADENGALHYAINDSMYDADAEAWNSYLKVNVTPQDGTTVKEVYAVFTSDNESLLTAMASKGFVDGRMNIYSDVATVAEGGDVSQYINVTDVADGVAGEKRITVRPAGMSALYKYAGTHTVSVYTTDSDNRTKHTDIIITVSNSGGGGAMPTIVWLDANGNDVINERHTINKENADTFQCKVDMSSEKGFTKLEVDIISDVLTDEELSSVNLGSHLDLINPEPHQIAVLQTLGFLDASIGETSLLGVKKKTFEISGFMALLRTLYVSNGAPSGNCDFEITVGDANGEVTKTLMLYIDTE